MKNFIYLLAVSLLSGLLSAQGSFFAPVQQKNLPDLNNTRLQRSDKVWISELTDQVSFHKALLLAPHEADAAKPEIVIELPSPDGEAIPFRLVRYTMITPSVQAMMPEFITAYGEDTQGLGMRLSLSWTRHGLNAAVRHGKKGRWLIDPVFAGEPRYLQSFYTKDSAPTVERECLFDEDLHGLTGLERGHVVATDKTLDDCSLRTHELAIACTGEYFQYMVNNYGGSGNDYATVFSRIGVSIARVNGIFREDLGITFTLINMTQMDTIQLLYDDPAVDPFTNTDANAMLTENNINTYAVLGAGNFDLGHVFSTSFGGVAGPGICFEATSPTPTQPGFAARGVTGLPSPETDAYDVDFVAHELGHQLGAGHTFNSNTGACAGGNRAAAQAFEPGSATTIMGYAGICSPNNIQPNSDPYFHHISLARINDEMNSNFSNYDPDGCALKTIGNIPPTVSAGLDYTIPTNTPFVLTATGSDPDGGGLTFCWEQSFVETPAGGEAAVPITPFTTEPTGAETNTPLFRSFPPVTSPERYFPELVSVVNGIGAGDWESLPTVAQTLYFAVTARDGVNNGGYGCPVIDKTMITVVATASQYGVTSPNGGEILGQNQTTTVTWEEAGTASAPISCANVDIHLSTDGGLTYPILLAANVTNNGSASVNMPNLSTSTARLRIRGSNNIFYDISDANFTLAPAGFALVGQTISAINCDAADQIGGYEVDLASIGGFSGNVALSATGLPAGVTAIFDQNTVAFAPGTTTTQIAVGLSLSGLTGLAPGNYSFQVVASSGGNSETVEMVVVIPLNVTSPADGGQVMLEFNSGCTNTGGAFFFSDIVFDPYTGPGTLMSYGMEVTANGIDVNISDVATLPFTTGRCYADGTVIVYTVLAKLTDGTSVPSCERSFTLRTTLLPVDWLAFNVRPVGKAAQLEWSVVQDEAHAGFTIERQENNATNWVPAGYVSRTAANGSADYQFTDRAVVVGSTYRYRLRQEDIDGNTSYSMVRTVTFEEVAYGISARPNPTNDFVQLVMGSKLPEDLTYELYSPLGQRITSGKVLAGQARIDLSALPAALYQVVISGKGDFREVVRIVKR